MQKETEIEVRVHKCLSCVYQIKLVKRTVVVMQGQVGEMPKIADSREDWCELTKSIMSQEIIDLETDTVISMNPLGMVQSVGECSKYMSELEVVPPSLGQFAAMKEMLDEDGNLKPEFSGKPKGE